MIALHGGGADGPRRGRHLRRRGPRRAQRRRGRAAARRAAGRSRSFSAHLAGLDTVPRAAAQRGLPQLPRAGPSSRRRSTSRCARPGMALHAALGRDPRPVTFVASVRLPEPPTLEPVDARLAQHPDLRFKLDPTPSWDDGADRRAGRARRRRDRRPQGPLLRHRRRQRRRPRRSTGASSKGLPDAWIEDPLLTAETEPVLAAHHDRITWDAPIHSVADVLALPFPPRMLNVKPSRFGTLRALLDFYDHCAANGDRLLRRRPDRARRRARPDPVPGLAVPPRHAQRRRAGRLQPRAAAGRAAGQPARAGAELDRLPLGRNERAAAGPSATPTRSASPTST